MTSAIVVALLILIGILLIVIEFLIAPGITVAGIGGLLLMAWGIYMSYDVFGTPAGHYVLIATVIVTIVVLYYSLRAKTWKKLMLNTKIDSDVSTENYQEKIKPGDTGKAITRLNPIGKVMVNDIILEGKSIIGFIDENSEIEVVKVFKNNIEVKLKENKS